MGLLIIPETTTLLILVQPKVINQVFDNCYSLVPCFNHEILNHSSTGFNRLYSLSYVNYSYLFETINVK